MMKEVKNLLFVLAVAIFFIGLFKICDSYAQDIKENYAAQFEASKQKSSKEASDELPVESETTLTSDDESGDVEIVDEQSVQTETEEETEE